METGDFEDERRAIISGDGATPAAGAGAFKGIGRE